VTDDISGGQAVDICWEEMFVALGFSYKVVMTKYKAGFIPRYKNRPNNAAYVNTTNLTHMSSSKSCM
jgi:hypothetical protein